MKKLLFVLWKISKADLRTLWIAFRHPERPWWVRPAAVLLLLYAMSPLNLMLPVIGLVDELVIIPLLLHVLVSILPLRLKFTSSSIRSA